MILFPSSFYSVTKVDECLQQEYDAAMATGLFEIALFGYDKWINDNKLIVRDVPDKEHLAVYRGWMMKPEQYEQLYCQLIEKNIRLITKPEQYRLMHIFPNAYKSVKEDTAKMEIYPLHTRIDAVKGTEFPKYFDASITQESFDQWMEVFYKYRGELLTGGICIKEFLDLKRYGDKTNEYRVFYINHEIATVCRNSGQGNYAKEPPTARCPGCRIIRITNTITEHCINALHKREK